MKTLFLFVLLLNAGIGFTQTANVDLVMPVKTDSVITIGSGNYWLGENETRWQNEDYKFGADPGRVKTFKVYPNPSSGTIHIDGLPYVNHELWILQLADMDGRLLYSVKLDPTEESINLPDVSRGNYVIKLMYKNFYYTSRITLF